MSRLRLTKLEATGNDFLVLVDLDDAVELAAEQVMLLCDRDAGPGADGLIRILSGRDGADLTMELTNADGGRAEMSGNGVRCVAAIAVRDDLVDGTRFRLATDAGVKTVEYAETAEGSWARVDMGPATFEPSEIPLEASSPFGVEADVDSVHYEGDAAGMGNPHWVLFVDDPDAAAVETAGPLLEHDDRFPNRTNVEFVAVEGDDRLRMRVWERGVGETRSCGTGACAAAAAAHRRGRVGERVRVDVPGGTLTVELGETVWLGGPVSIVSEVEAGYEGYEGTTHVS